MALVSLGSAHMLLSLENEILGLCLKMVEVYCWLLRHLVRSCVLYWVILGLVWI
jgi:hypothetical protein